MTTNKANKRKPFYLFVDQYGAHFYAATVKELCQKVGYSKARRMFIDTKDGDSLHIGYVIGPHWLTQYAPVERKG